MTTKALLVLSGGQDSTTCGFWAKGQFDEVHALTIDYGQRHKIEIDCAREIVRELGFAHEVLSVGSILNGTSPLVSGAELDQYKDMHSLPGGLEKTFVPARNLLFLTIAANRAYCLGTPNIITGVCQEDFGGYPDCRRTFIDALQNTLNEGMPIPINDERQTLWRIFTPLMYLTKAESIDFALGMPGCYHALGYTHTSYDGAYPPTGHDHATLLRAKGFLEAKVPDPLVVRAWVEDKMYLPKTPNYTSFSAELVIFKKMSSPAAALYALEDMLRGRL